MLLIATGLWISNRIVEDDQVIKVTAGLVQQIQTVDTSKIPEVISILRNTAAGRIRNSDGWLGSQDRAEGETSRQPGAPTGRRIPGRVSRDSEFLDSTQDEIAVLRDALSKPTNRNWPQRCGRSWRQRNSASRVY